MTALHRAELILEAALSALTGAELPALLVWMGEDELLTEYSHDQADYRLAVHVDIVAATITPPVETPLNAIRREVTVALAADHTLGLAFVETLHEAGATEPSRMAAGDRPAAMQTMVWQATYRRSRLDPAT